MEADDMDGWAQKRSLTSHERLSGWSSSLFVQKIAILMQCFSHFWPYYVTRRDSLLLPCTCRHKTVL